MLKWMTRINYIHRIAQVLENILIETSFFQLLIILSFNFSSFSTRIRFSDVILSITRIKEEKRNRSVAEK